MNTRANAAILGLAGPELSEEERQFFAETDPLGFILFARNVEDPMQLADLTASLTTAVGRPDAPILIDQEGGRVQRMAAPHWRVAPAAARFGELYKRAPTRGLEAAALNARLLAHDLAGVGITVDCAPLLDVPVADAHDVIGDRAFDDDPDVVAALGRATCVGLLTGRVLPVVKHIPGHGRARADSHESLPVVDAALEDLIASDLAPFKSLAEIPWAMTAHVIYTALDAERPATLSPVVIEETIRGRVGFNGVLISDDIGMGALTGSFKARTEGCLAAGCDVVLHCSGVMAEMVDVMAGCAPLSNAAVGRLVAGDQLRQMAPPSESFDPDEALARLDALLATVAA